MRDLLLDTHVLIWLMSGDSKLSHSVIERIEQTRQSGHIWVSAITPWEIGLLAARKRIILTKDVQEWMDDVLLLQRLQLAPLEPHVAIASSHLPGEVHGDPADRIIVATTRHLGATLVTADAKLLAYGAEGYVMTLKASGS
jgi:PIN domain nuclease of toxin-antitoxin system